MGCVSRSPGRLLVLALTVACLARPITALSAPISANGVLSSSSSPASLLDLQPNLFGSGLRIRFPATAGSSYCLVSDPCVHVNVLMSKVGRRKEDVVASGVGMRTGRHSLQLLLSSSSSPPSAASPEATAAAAQYPFSSVVLDGTEVSEQLLASGSVVTEDAEWALDLGQEGSFADGAGSRAVLVTAGECGVRFLLRITPSILKGVRGPPQVAVEALDWASMTSPHGLMGQLFPNCAKKWLPVSAAVQAHHSRKERLGVSQGAIQGPRGGGQGGTLEGQRGSGGVGAKAPLLSGEEAAEARLAEAGEALEGLWEVAGMKAELDGVPEDYQNSGLLEADCVFSRFEHEEKVGPTGLMGSGARRTAHGVRAAQGEVLARGGLGRKGGVSLELNADKDGEEEEEEEGKGEDEVEGDESGVAVGVSSSLSLGLRMGLRGSNKVSSSVPGEGSEGLARAASGSELINEMQGTASEQSKERNEAAERREGQGGEEGVGSEGVAVGAEAALELLNEMQGTTSKQSWKGAGRKQGGVAGASKDGAAEGARGAAASRAGSERAAALMSDLRMLNEMQGTEADPSLLG